MEVLIFLAHSLRNSPASLTLPRRMYVILYSHLKVSTNAVAKGVKALISIGGWTGSKYFSTNFGSEKNRTAFVKTCVDFVKKHDLDGIDFE
jgi:GH18 family chitinase